MKGVGFVRALREAGHDVEVATGFPNYPGGKIYPGYRVRPLQVELIDGVKINRLALYPSHSQSALGRAVNYLSFFISAFLFTLVRLRSFDVIYAYHPPITPALAASLIGWAWRKPVIVDIQDLWPDSVAASGMVSSHAVSRVLGAICRFVYWRATAIIVQSDGMKELLISRGVPAHKLSRIYNWAAEDSLMSSHGFDLSKYGLDGRFNIVYAGNLGVAQGLESLIRAAALAAQTAPEIQLLLIGNGVHQDRLKNFALSAGGGSTKMFPGVSRREIAAVLAAADVQVLHLTDKPLYRSTVPQKLQFYFAVGKPILAAVSGEAGRLVTDSSAGLAAPPDRPTEIARTMLEFVRMPPERRRAMAQAASRAYRERFSFAKAVEATIRVLTRVEISTRRSAE